MCSDLIEGRGVAIELQGVERLMAACARNDSAKVRAISAEEPELVRELVAQGGKLLAEFAGVGNADGVRHLLDLGVDVNSSDRRRRSLFRCGEEQHGAALGGVAGMAFNGKVFA